MYCYYIDDIDDWCWWSAVKNIIILGKEGRISHRSFLMTSGLYVLYELS